jgi:hypothetical protein
MRDTAAARLAGGVDSSEHIGIERSFDERFEKFNSRLDAGCRKLLDQIVQSLFCAHGCTFLISSWHTVAPQGPDSFRVSSSSADAQTSS